jgi:hypothetical protein
MLLIIALKDMLQERNFASLLTWDLGIQSTLYQPRFISFQVSKPLEVFNVSLEPVTFTTLKDCRLLTACITLRRTVVLLYRLGQRFRNEAALAFSPFRAILWPALYYHNVFKFLMFLQLYVFAKEALIEIVSLSTKATNIIVWLLVA